MIDFLQCFFAAIGTVAAFLAISYGIVSAWTAFSESAERKRKDTQRALKLLESIEANTARSETTPNSDPA